MKYLALVIVGVVFFSLTKTFFIAFDLFLLIGFVYLVIKFSSK